MLAMSAKPPSIDETLTEHSRPDPGEVLELSLTFSGATAKPSSVRLDAPRVIGSGPDADVVIAHPMVSRAHVEVRPDVRGAYVQDLGSRNGTFYLGQRIERAVLRPGATFQVGPASVAIGVALGTPETSVPFAGEAYRGVVGRSTAMKRLFSVLVRLERWQVPVLLEGESGVGKEVFAKAIHEGSSRAAEPFVAINCGALPRELVGSELFGHRKGAFTGASEHRKGAFESAHGGTLFLDEIGELPLDVQPILLRVLETGEVRRVGDDTVTQLDVRVIAATHRDLDADVGQGRFREDLLFRLAVVRLRIPPLRERPEDIELLADRFALALGLGAPDAVLKEQLKQRSWPGNARELRNALQAHAVLGSLPSSPNIRPEALELVLDELVDPRAAYADQKDAFVDRFTKVYLARLLESSRGNRSVAARVADLDRGYLRKLLAKHGLGEPGRDDE